MKKALALVEYRLGTMEGAAVLLWPLQGPPMGGSVGATGDLEITVWMIPLGLVVFMLWAARRWGTHEAEGRRREAAEENRSKARSLYEAAFGTGDFSVIDDIVAEEFLDHRGRGRGPKGLKRAVAGLRRTFPDLRVSVEEQDAQGDTVTTRCALCGTDRGGLLWYPPTGRRVTFAATYTDRFSGGVLVEHWGESDTGSLLEQLGLPPRDG
jgi:predicted ester cyclase